jgi:very-short-patch-repair endonuclease
MKKLNKKEVINRLNELFNNKYNYSLLKFKNTKSHVDIICPVHDIFHKRLDKHLSGEGCPYCSRKKVNDKLRKKQEDYLKECNEVHFFKYDYSKTFYEKCNCYIKIICPNHGEFKIRADHHRRGQGCKLCAYEKSSENQRKKQEIFIKEAKEIHDNKYDYSLVKYINNYSKIIIICPIHGKFTIKPHDHIIHKMGCSNCNESKGEREIRKFLINNNIEFESQYRFENCKNKNSLPFDFYLKNNKTCIEFDGKQHYEIIKYFGGEENFKKIKINDKIKNDFCKENKINLIRISYKEINKVKDILKKVVLK